MAWHDIDSPDYESVQAVQGCLDSIDANLESLRDFPGPDDPIWEKFRDEAEKRYGIIERSWDRGVA